MQSSLIMPGDEDSNSEQQDDVWGAPIGPLPTVSSKINFAEDILNIKHDLWVVGSGQSSTNLK